MDDVIGCNWLLTQLNGLKVEEKENYNSKFLCQNATVQCRLKKNQENNQKSQKKSSFFLQKTKTNSRSNWKWLLYVTHQKNQYTKPILLRHLDVFTKKKSNSKYGTGNHWLCTTRKRIKKTTRTLELELPQLLITVFLFVDVSFSPKKIPSCTLTKRNEWTHHTITKSAAPKSIIIHAVP